MSKLMIYDETHGFWSKSRGWVNESKDALKFTKQHTKDFVLPTPASIWTAWRGDLVHNVDTYIRIDDNKALMEQAKKFFQRDGELEIDIPSDRADIAECVSRGDDPGAYVRAWVWVQWEQIKLKPEKI